MENGRYNLEKAQEEADKLTKKVKSGGASNYAEAEKQLEQETESSEKPIDKLMLRYYLENMRDGNDRNRFIKFAKENPSRETQEATMIAMSTIKDLDFIVRMQKELPLPGDVIQQNLELQENLRIYSLIIFYLITKSNSMKPYYFYEPTISQ